MLTNGSWRSGREILGSGGDYGEMGHMGPSLRVAEYHHVRKTVDSIASNSL